MNRTKKALLIYPEFPPSFWSFGYALRFVGKKSAMPPLGLMTVAGLFSADWELKLVDMNVEPLTDIHLRWVQDGYVFTSTMVVQQESLRRVIARCSRAGIPVVAGGPHPTSFHDEIQGVSHFVLGEVEETFPQFLKDLTAGSARAVYFPPARPDVTHSPLPRYDLIDPENYGSAMVQFSRGCPFKCEFCDIPGLFGNVPRTKTPEGVLSEFSTLYNMGWRGPVFLVDDNFIGNHRLAYELLQHVTVWQREHGHPFRLYTEASVNLARMPHMLEAMAEAGFDMVFLGIESPNEVALRTTQKPQNVDRGMTAGDYLLGAVREIQRYGIQVTGGFIIGLDGDGVFDPHVRFIEEAGIPIAMAGLLTAIRGSPLYERLEREGRLLKESTGNNTEIKINFVSELPEEQLISAYKEVIATLYEPTLKNFFARCLTMFEHLGPPRRLLRRLPVGRAALCPLIWHATKLLFSRRGFPSVRFLYTVARKYPERLNDAIALVAKGLHLEMVTRCEIAADDFRTALQDELETFRAYVGAIGEIHHERVEALHRRAEQLVAGMQEQYKRIHADFRGKVADALDAFQKEIHAQLALKQTSK